MNWTRFCLATLAAGIVGFLSDGAFMGTPFIHKEYAKTPETWRPNPPGGEKGRIAVSTLLTFASAAVFVYVCARVGISSYRGTLKLALAFWTAGVLPLIISNHLFIRLTSKVSWASALNWAVHFLASALSVVWIYG